MFLSFVLLNKLKHFIDKTLSSFNIKFKRFKLIIGKIVLFSSLSPFSFTLVIHCNLYSLINCTLGQHLWVYSHLVLRLSHHKSLLFSISHNQKFDSLSPKTSLLTIICHNRRHCRSWTLVPQDLFWFIQIIKITQINSNNILPSLRILISLFCFLICSLTFFCFTIFNQNGFCLHFVHYRSCLLKHLEL